MVAEEIALNEHLEALGIAPIETDLGEYIIQLRHEPPSHIIAPAVHLTKDQVAEPFSSITAAGLHQRRPSATIWWPRRATCCARSSSTPMSA